MNYILEQTYLRTNDMTPEQLFWSLFVGIRDKGAIVPIKSIDEMIAHPRMIFIDKKLKYSTVSSYLPIVDVQSLIPSYAIDSYLIRHDKVVAVVQGIAYESIQFYTLPIEYVNAFIRKATIDEILATL